MNIKIQLSVLFLSVSFFGFIFNNLRKERLDLKYTLIWLFVSISLIIISLFPQIIIWITHLINIETPVNTLFLFGIFFLMVITFMQTIIISKLMLRVKTIAQELAIFKHEQKQKDN